MITALLVIGILVLLIVAHELGHFFAAKIFGVRVEEFGVGYPPRAFRFGKIGDTEYTLNWIPFGGFVRLFGDEGEAQHGRGSFVDAPRWKQACVLVAGVTANVLVAWVLFAFALHLGVPKPVETARPGQSVQLIAADVVPGSPADAAGIKPGDEITGMSDATGAMVRDLTAQNVVSFVRARPGKPVDISYVHAGKKSTATITPANAVLPKAASQPALGIALVLIAIEPEPWDRAVVDASRQTLGAFKMVGRDLWTLAEGAIRGNPDISGVVGPVGIVGYVGEASQNGLGAVLMFAALISINLAIINLIPIPALDGGRLLVLGIETLMRRDAPRLAVQVLNALGVALIVLLMVVVTYNDVARLLA
ncbi:site-2 protease family protein [Candidatus Kaiserbacteria bacterium]|nr:site-2 protease family protein [Candidatus Kaiserbacteria bacterium]